MTFIRITTMPKLAEVKNKAQKATGGIKLRSHIHDETFPYHTKANIDFSPIQVFGSSLAHYGRYYPQATSYKFNTIRTG